MRVLLVAGFFPPFAPMGGIRPSKLAKFLLDRGHDVRVLAARDLPSPPLLPIEIPEERICYSPWYDVNALPKRLAAYRNRRERVSSSSAETRQSGPADSDTQRGRHGLRPALRRASTLYVNL